MGTIYIENQGTKTPHRGSEKPQEGRKTIRVVEIALGGEKDARQLAFELEAGLCFASECVEGLCRLDGNDVLGTLEVLRLYLGFLNTVASECYRIIPKGGDAS
jgi:hypothetical protein